jgi:thiol-disulfide isomerase/thioredoxin
MNNNLYDKSTIIKELKHTDFVLQDDGKSYLKNVKYLNNPMIIKFYAPWCIHCKNMSPTLEKLGTKYKSKGLKIGAVNCMKQDINNKVNVDAFPTIFFITSKGKLKKYNGNVDMNSLSNNIKKIYF